MAEVFVEFAEPVLAKDGRTFLARACGSEMNSHLWQGWVEFVPMESGVPLSSGRETTQPNRQDAEYWATGLTPVYLEGALERALNPLPRATPSITPSPILAAPPAVNETAPPAHDSVLNPFSVYRKGESLLRSQLTALSGWHLVNIIEAYRLSEQKPTALESTPAPVLVELIVASVRERAATAAER